MKQSDLGKSLDPNGRFCPVVHFSYTDIVLIH
jgi:hypothetical protein